MDLSSERLQALSPQLRRAARFIVEHSGDVATRSQRHISTVSQLPAPTFTRLARAVGLQSYDQLRDLCREDVLRNKTILADRAKSLIAEVNENAEEPSLIARHAASAIRNLQRVVEQTDPDRLTNAAQLLADARRVVLIGEMSARGLMDYVSYMANMSLTEWKVLDRASESLSSELAFLGSKDACIVTAVSPYSTRSLKIVRHIVEAGIPVVAITDNALSPLVSLADHSFFVVTESPQFFPSHVALTVVLEVLIDMVIRERGIEAQKHIAAVERQNHKLNEYWQEDLAANKGE
tara:strand:- start:190 stop:1068 length:879 start_codon:yes stop_codon:yes gene_type:complete